MQHEECDLCRDLAPQCLWILGREVSPVWIVSNSSVLLCPCTEQEEQEEPNPSELHMSETMTWVYFTQCFSGSLHRSTHATQVDHTEEVVLEPALLCPYQHRKEKTLTRTREKTGKNWIPRRSPTDCPFRSTVKCGWTHLTVWDANVPLSMSETQRESAVHSFCQQLQQNIVFVKTANFL